MKLGKVTINFRGREVRSTIFAKILAVLFILIIPIVAFFVNYSVKSMDIIRNELEETNMNRMHFLINQIDANINRFSNVAFTISRDPDAIKFQASKFQDVWFDTLLTKQTLLEKISLQSNASNWANQITVYSPLADDGVSTLAGYVPALTHFMGEEAMGRWSYRSLSANESFFVFSKVEPASYANRLDKANLIVEVAISNRNLVQLLDQYKLGSSGDPFLYHADYTPVLNRTADAERTRRMAEALANIELGGKGNEIVLVDGREYMVIYELADSLNWYLVDYIPLEEALKPLEDSRNSFYITMLILLLLSIVAALLLYWQVQVPIKQLARAVRQFKQGNYAISLNDRTNNEFGFLNKEFNAMARQIQQLIQSVYQEQIRGQKAMLKELQAQINPHFLYNCFAIIQSMIHLDNKKAAIAMTQHLNHYYRYTTRTDEALVQLRDEIRIADTYLGIIKMQIVRLEYEIHLQEDMQELRIPKLLIQPLIENAVIHGIDNQVGPGRIQVAGYEDVECYYVIIEDNGKELTDTELERIRAILDQPMDHETGFGIWNVHHRLKLHYGEGSGLSFARSRWGGLSVTIAIPKLSEG